MRQKLITWLSTIIFIIITFHKTMQLLQECHNSNFCIKAAFHILCLLLSAVRNSVISGSLGPHTIGLKAFINISLPFSSESHKTWPDRQTDALWLLTWSCVCVCVFLWIPPSSYLCVCVDCLSPAPGKPLFNFFL